MASVGRVSRRSVEWGGCGGGAVRFKIKTAVLELVESDITAQDVEAIVNAANSSLLGGWGVDCASHPAGGPEIQAACRQLGGWVTGEAKNNTGGPLRARDVIHALGPIYPRGGAERAAELLAGAYRRSLEIAAEHGVRSLAFPAISTGAYGYPMEQGARVALQTVIDYLTDQEDNGIRLVRFVLFSKQAYQVFQRALSELAEDAAQA